ncbi:MAG TPA: NAD(P)/FAD-dependent oxidoreductase [Nitrospiraceae bacterium]|nr:NAD(P)/FAD-dependent oxidoreductase [Nitrospiraceae bacterium]
MDDGKDTEIREVIIVGSGLAGLSAAIYLGRSRRDTLLIHSGRSMAKWETDVQNYLGFPEGINGGDLLAKGMAQVARYQVETIEDEIQSLLRRDDTFWLGSAIRSYRARRVLLATGLTHLPPEIPGVRECLGRSLFFCKDCDAYRVQDKRIGIVGRNNEAADYALAMLFFSHSIVICLNGQSPAWDADHAGWLDEYRIPIRSERIDMIRHDDGRLETLIFGQGEPLKIEALFTTRGDVYHSGLAESAGAALDREGQVIVDHCLRTTVPGLYAAGCVTPANCQMIIAAGQGAIAAQAINRDLFEDQLRRHALPGGERVFARRDEEMKPTLDTSA